MPLEPKLFDTRSVRDDAEHWDALARRVAVDAARRSRSSALEWLARTRAIGIAAVLMLAVTALMLASQDRSTLRLRTGVWAEAFAPADGVGRAIVSAAGPPAIVALLFARRGGG